MKPFDLGPVAKSVPYDNTDCDLVAVDTKDALDELCDRINASASPAASFGRSGNIPPGTFLLRPGGVPSNKTGVPMSITNPVIKLVAVGNENVNTFDIEVFEHEGDEVNLTLLGTVSVVAKRTDTFSVNFIATTGRQLAIKTKTGSSKNPGVDVQFSGSTS